MKGWGGSRNKLGNVRASLDGYSFASKLEAAVYQLLKFRQLAGEIADIQVQDHVYLTEARIHYIPDFKCKGIKTGADIWVEAKGHETDVWRIKRKLWLYYGPGNLEIWKGTYQRPFLHDVIKPMKG